MMSLWNAVLLAALGPLFVVPFMLRRPARLRVATTKGSRS